VTSGCTSRDVFGPCGPETSFLEQKSGLRGESRSRNPGGGLDRRSVGKRKIVTSDLTGYDLAKCRRDWLRTGYEKS